jgi:hypothetical protein
MLKSLHKALFRRLQDLQQTVTSSTQCEVITRDFIVNTIGHDTLQFVKKIHHLPSGELLILTTHKAFASELTMRKDALLEYVQGRGEKVTLVRIQ